MIFNILVSQDYNNPRNHELILYVTCLIYLRGIYYAAKAIRRELKDRVIHSIFMIISFFTVSSLQEEKLFRDLEQAEQSNFWCQPVWIVIRMNSWCDFVVTALKSMELNPFSLQGALPASFVLGFCWLGGVPVFPAVRPSGVAQRGFNDTEQQ